MSEIYRRVSDMIGDTPLLELVNYEKLNELDATIFAKLEFFNPAGSVKDRVAKSMIDDAENNGLLRPGSVIIEPTSGNTGIGLASIAAERGYRIILTMPDTMSAERRSLLKAYGAELVLTDGALGMKGAVDKAEELARETEGGFIPAQFDNPANPAAHRTATGPEIWRDTWGRIDYFVACVGSGGTLTGVGEYLKEQNPDIRVIAVEPEGSPLLSKGITGSHRIQGIGANFVPAILNKSVYDDIITVSDEDAFDTARIIAKTEGILVGISSGAAAFASTLLASRSENTGKVIVTLFPDSGERYLSAALFG